MVKTFVANILNLPDPKENPNLLDEFLQDRKEKILSHKNLEGRKQSFASTLLLQKILLQNNLNLQDVKFVNNKKPEIDGIFFNISHSDNFVICSVSENPVGCDIEKIRCVKSGFEKRFFTQNEVAYLEKFSCEEKEFGTKVKSLLKELNIPCGYGFSASHELQKATLPLNVNYKINFATGEVVVTEKYLD
jgi:4'-phosphopantetheinyl transferase